LVATKDNLVVNQKTYEFLKQVRASKTVALKPCTMLRTEIVGLDGVLQPFKIRYYQVQGIMHLLTQKRMVLGDATGTGKTIEIIGALCYTWEKETANKVIVVSPKSALRQWEEEIYRFTTGIKVFVVDGKPAERLETYEAFKSYQGPDKAVMVMCYAPLVRDWNAGASRPLLPNGQPDMKADPTAGLLDTITKGIPSLTIVFDEATAFKNMRTKTWQVCSQLSIRSNRVYGVTATLLKNNLIEGFAIYKCVHPDVFSTLSKFHDDYCKTKLQPIRGSNRKIPIVVGYHNLQMFRDRIDPFFLGRPKHLVSDELPKLITKEVKFELSAAEDAKYEEALTGYLALGDGEVKDYSENKTLVALIYCQRIIDSLALLKFNEGDMIDTDRLFMEQDAVQELGSKEQALMDLLTEDFDDEKVIVYTRFSSHVPRLQELCKKAGIKSVAVTGDVENTKKNPARERAKRAFQDLNSDTRLIFISDAGSEAINLQAASAMIFYNSPWSWGNYLQLLGRPIRIGSPHQHVVAVHLISERPRSTKKARRTMDQYTIDTLQRKKDLIDKVLGEAAVGALDFGTGESFVAELAKAIRADHKGKP
jgi:SNF2 family DNA or RNA helicase